MDNKRNAGHLLNCSQSIGPSNSISTVLAIRLSPSRGTIFLLCKGDISYFHAKELVNGSEALDGPVRVINGSFSFTIITVEEMEGVLHHDSQSYNIQ